MAQRRLGVTNFVGTRRGVDCVLYVLGLRLAGLSLRPLGLVRVLRARALRALRVLKV